MSSDNLALTISICSFVVAALALGWNIYRDVVLKARVKVDFSLSHLVGPGRGPTGPHINVSVVNLGPGPVTINSICARKYTLWTLLTRRPAYFFVTHDYTNPLSSKLPSRIDVGETLNLLLPWSDSSVLSVRPSLVGVRDSFGREHFASRRSVRATLKAFDRDFPDAADLRKD